PSAVRNRRGGRVRQGRGRLRARGRPAGPSTRPNGHDRGQARLDSGAADARRREAREGRFRDRYGWRPIHNRKPGERHSRLSRNRHRSIDSDMREIVFDTETTGLNPLGGDRMVEIGCIEIVNRVETGRHFHAYFYPEREMPFEAELVHGLTNAFLSDKPLFADKAEELLDFLEDSPLVAHNASFD